MATVRRAYVCLGATRTPSPWSTACKRFTHHHAPTPHSDLPVVFGHHGSSAMVTLNRPKALNSLNLAMVRLLAQEVPHWELDDKVATVVLKGAGGKAFCAGGDIKTLFEAKGTADGAAHQADFFREEYTLDYNLARSSSKKPHVALYDGTVMGGGVGISINATFRVATEKSLFAMPETGIGFFPDVGGSYFLSRLPKHFGFFLALTGHRLKGADMVHAGVATHFVPSEVLPLVEKEIAALPAGKHAKIESTKFHVEAILRHHSTPLAPFSFSEDDSTVLSHAFSKHSVEQVLASLKASASKGSNVAAQAAAAIQKMSPTSLKITLEQVHRGTKLSLAECYKMEYRVAHHLMTGHDFYEGVSSVLVRKDNKPHWKPATLEEVSQDDVGAAFSPLPESQELQLV